MPHNSPGRRTLHGGGGRLLVCCSVIAAVGVVLWLFFQVGKKDGLGGGEKEMVVSRVIFVSQPLRIELVDLGLRRDWCGATFRVVAQSGALGALHILELS